MMDERDAMLEEMKRNPVFEYAPTAQPTDQKLETKAAPDYTQMGEYGNSMGAWNGNEKFKGSWDDKSERYKMLTVLSHFDPRQGITPEAINALNSANIYGAKFSGSGDKLTVDNAGGYDRFGKGGTADIIQGFKTGNGTWSPWQVDDNPQQAGGARGPVYTGGDGLTTSDAVQSLTQGSTYNNLVQRLQALLGPASTDRDALMSLLKR